MSILNDFSLQTTDFSSISDKPEKAIVNDWFGMMLDIGPLRETFISKGQPYRFTEGRILMVTRGSSKCEFNLEEVSLVKGDVVVLAPETIMELKECSKDFSMTGIIYKESIPVPGNIILKATPNQWDELMRLAHVLWDIAHHEPCPRETVQRLVATMISYIQDIDHEIAGRRQEVRLNRKERLFHDFKKLVQENYIVGKNIPFYAEKLFVSPHYLSAVITKVSGRSVMYWINKVVILQAKVMLKYNNLMVYEVADKLGFPSQSAFGKYFKRETGISPGDYRKS